MVHFDDIPAAKWRDRLYEMAAWTDLQMLRANATTASILRELATRFTGSLRDWFDTLGEYRQLQFVQLPNVSSALFVIHEQFIGESTAVFEAARRDYLNMKCCSLNSKDLDFHYKRMSILFYKLNGFNDRTLKHVFMASLPEELQPDIQRQLTSLNLTIDNISLGKIFQIAKGRLEKLYKAIRLLEHLQATTDYSPHKDEIEFYFSEQEEPIDETMFALQNSSDDSENDEFQTVFHQQLLSLDTTIPIPSIKLHILPSKFQRPIPAIGLLDSKAQRSMINPDILPSHSWQHSEENFKAVNGKFFTTQLITQKPIGIQIFPNCVISIKVIGSHLPNKDILLGFDIIHQINHLQIIPTGIRVKSMFKLFTNVLKLYGLSETSQLFLDISTKFLKFCLESHADFHHPNPLWKNPQFFVQLPFKLNEDVNPTKAIHLGMSPSDLVLAQKECSQLLAQARKAHCSRAHPLPDQNLSKRQIQQFLGIINYVRDFIPHIDHHTRQLSALLKKNPPLWNNNHTLAVTTLKQIAQNPPPLKLITDGRRILQTDASDESWGAILVEETDGKEHFIAYASGNFSNTQIHYHSVCKEILAIKHGIQKFEYHLIGYPTS
ncbi:hypothetical protein KPL70_003610 [Citrus sinensis]|nr:hypothetical protein KPL70_003610 [Citrus sinensis]